MEIIILAGGLGTRLRSVVSEVPKCMAPVAEKPFLWYLLKYLTKYNVTHVVLSVGYLREVIYKWIDQVKLEFPFQIDYAIEEEPLGTGGGIKLALKYTSNPNVCILNGDTFFDVNLTELYNKHISTSAGITIALKPMNDFDRYGNVQLNTHTGLITAFDEKKYCPKGLINGGVYILNKMKYNWFEGLPTKFSFETDVLHRQCSHNRLYGVIQDRYFIDIGIPEDYTKANNEFSKICF